jgi:hypothetical protein
VGDGSLNGLQVQTLPGNKTSRKGIGRLVVELPKKQVCSVVKPFTSTFTGSTRSMLAQGRPFTPYLSLLTLQESALLLRHWGCVFGRLHSAFGRML